MVKYDKYFFVFLLFTFSSANRFEFSQQLLLSRNQVVKNIKTFVFQHKITPYCI